VSKDLKVIVLDAMGVIYSVKDDVLDLLFPFIAEKGGSRDISKIQENYHSASLGEMTAAEFWKAVGIAPELEDEYLQRHTLTNGVIEFLVAVKRRGHPIWCLSNDLSEWSKKLRLRFGLDKYFAGCVISGDVNVRKPDLAIYYHLIKQFKRNPQEALLVDDNPKNLDSAASLGFETVLFRPTSSRLTNKIHKTATTFDEILSLLC